MWKWFSEMSGDGQAGVLVGLFFLAAGFMAGIFFLAYELIKKL